MVFFGHEDGAESRQLLAPPDRTLEHRVHRGTPLCYLGYYTLGIGQSQSLHPHTFKHLFHFSTAFLVLSTAHFPHAHAVERKFSTVGTMHMWINANHSLAA
jgi:hypothetical protein